MEQKRTLWIVLASGIFLLVILVTTLILYAPQAGTSNKAKLLSDSGEIWTAPVEVKPLDLNIKDSSSIAPGEEASVTSSLDAPLEGIAYQNENAALASQEEIPSFTAENLTVIANGTTNVYSSGNTTIDLNSLKNGTYEENLQGTSLTGSSVTAANQVAEKAMKETANAHRVQEKTTIERTVEKKNTQSISEPVTATVKKASASTASTSAKNTGSSNSKAVSSSSSGATASSGTKASTQTVKPITTVTSYWVQAASYSSKKNADEARSILDENKIQCEVFTYKNSKGTLYYRVRVGPYTTKSEAEYWKKKIDSIPQFAKSGSYVTSTTQAQ